ncbi:ABC transporter substrate-binding protein [Gluconacetobacter sacchari]|uniref:ABC transporter substrate-binding protein n=1 Tax=Gluconacetobacter sacchari TaxID=92759 RepID=A0A7W4IEM5_9PROT|nr:ABC transporter substrate-binding protein [Gluconacetobacter sacchari]MBB2161440.1 ABC transporter substrate-binding protein [Gluconacetobacter sacchari]
MRRYAAQAALRLVVTTGCLVWPAIGYGRVVVDMAGQRVTVPDHPARIADLWFAHNAVTIMLGATARIAVTNDLPATRPWMYRVAPGLHRATGVVGQVPNVEMLRDAGVDVGFVSTGAPALTPMRRIGLPVVQAGFTDEASLRQAVALTAEVLGDQRARDKARRYGAMLDATRDRVAAMVGGTVPSRRPRVLHIQSLAPLKIDGTHTIIDEWITRAGGRNVADIPGNMRPVSVEQVAAWDPDIIILGGDAGAFDPASAQWAGLRAVRAGHVYRNPAGVFPWDRYGVEFPLQLLWAARTLYPDRFATLDMVSETIKFYRDFFGYDLSSTDAARILAAEGPDRAP